MTTSLPLPAMGKRLIKRPRFRLARRTGQEKEIGFQSLKPFFVDSLPSFAPYHGIRIIPSLIMGRKLSSSILSTSASDIFSKMARSPRKLEIPIRA